MPSSIVGSFDKHLTQTDKRIRRNLLQACIETGSLVKRTQEVVVQGWSIDIKFGVDASATPNMIKAVVLVNGKNAAIWFYLDRGTGRFGPEGRSYVIRAKNADKLYFRTGYAPRTRPIAKFGGPGQKFGPLVSKDEVIHPGIEPRKFTKETIREVRPIFIENINVAIYRKK